LNIQKLLVCGLAGVLLAACDSGPKIAAKGDAGTEVSTEAQSKSTSDGPVVAAVAKAEPAAADSKPKPHPSPDQVAVIETGKELFEDNCEACHQADAIGQPGVAPSLTTPELLSIASDKFLISTIADGRDGTSMAAFGEDLKPDEIKAIVAFLRSQEIGPNRSAEVDAQPDAHGDPRLGKQWFNDICSTCHGVNGNGYEAGGTGTAIGLPGFLSKVSDGFIRETIKYGRSNTRMRGFSSPNGLANLSDQEIDDIITYMRELGKKNAAAEEE